MSFKTKKIRHRPRRRPLKKAKKIGLKSARLFKKLPRRTKNYLVAGILVFFGFFVVLKVTTASYHFIANFNFKELITVVGADLKKDENGYTNILLLGDGGHVRDGADLIDTIMVASIDYKKNAVSLLSIPRDFYIKADKTSGILYSSRINELYRNHKNIIDDEDQRFGLIKKAAGQIAGLDLQYYIRLDFNAFVDIVDSLDGIAVEVQEAIYDPYYPNETDDGYTVFSLEEGLQQMDGETALKFVRSRKTTSDFDRAARQQLVIEAVQQKALSRDILTSPGKLKGLYGAVKQNVNTDMSLREMISMAGFGKQMDRSRLVRKMIHDDPGQEGGFLYTPERELYGGRFVLIPFGNDYDLIHKYTNLIFHRREIFFEPPKIEILNATRTSGIARNSAYQLIRFGFDVQEIDNYYDSNDEKAYLEQSLIEYHDYTQDSGGLTQPRHQAVLNALDGFVKAVERPSDSAYLTTEEKNKKIYEGSRINLSIILGSDYDVFLVN